LIIIICSYTTIVCNENETSKINEKRFKSRLENIREIIMSSETATNARKPTILTKDYRWTTFAFIVDVTSLTLLNGVVLSLMVLHRIITPTITYKNWVIALVGVFLELIFLGIAFLDARRRNPAEQMFNARIFNMFPFILIMLFAIFSDLQFTSNFYPIVYGAISGGFAGYLAGGLVYGNFFIKVKDIIFRTIFGGWIGVTLGAMFGSIFALLLDPFGGGVFGGIFLGFWGGAIVSGPIATVLLHFLRKNEKFSSFFSQMFYYGKLKEIQRDLEEYFSNSQTKQLKLKDCKVFEKREEEKIVFRSEKDKTLREKFLRGLIYIIYLFNPWVPDTEDYRIKTFTTLFEQAAQKAGLTFEDGVIKK